MCVCYTCFQAISAITSPPLNPFSHPPSIAPLPPAADFAVSCALDAYAAARKAGGTWQLRARRLALRCGLHGVRAVMVLGAVAIGDLTPPCSAVTVL